MKIPRGYGDEYEDPLEPGTSYGRPMPWNAPPPPKEWVLIEILWEGRILLGGIATTALLVFMPHPRS